MKRRAALRCGAVVALSITLLLSAAQSVWGQRFAPSKTDPSAKPMPLVNADPDMATYLNRIEGLVKDKAFSDAIRLLQDMVAKSEGYFEASTDGRVFESLQSRANKLIGSMGPEGLELYRDMNDATAEALYKDGLNRGDMGQLQRVATQFLLTNFGPKSLDALAAIHFDAGRFYQAACCWKQILSANQMPEQAPLLKAKMAVAYHLGGEAKQAAAVLADLKANHAGASAKLGGEDQKIEEFVTKAFAMAPVAIGAAGRKAAKEWPGWGAVGNGMAMMDDCDVVLSPRWLAGRNPMQNEPDALMGNLVKKDKLLIDKDCIASAVPNYGTPMDVIAEMKDGRIRIRAAINANNPNYYGGPQVKPGDGILPGMIHPVVVDEKVIYRTKDHMYALDLMDGSIKWSTQDGNPAMLMVRQLKANPARNYYSYGNQPQAIRPLDAGRYALTAGEGRVYALTNFRPPIVSNQFRGGAPEKTDDSMLDNSHLVAFSVESGKLVWETGTGKNDEEIVRNGKFISAPAYADGRLYIMAVYLDGYHLLCLNAQSGSLLWKQFICQGPAVNTNNGVSTDRYHMGSPPAVVDGRVYALTNAGVVAAADAQSGQALWAYQYESILETKSAGPMYGQAPVTPSWSANPMIVTRGRLIMLPSDGNKVVAINCDDGTPMWSADRAGKADITGIDQDRFLLSNDGLKIMSTLDGREIKDVSGIVNVSGRPAVTAKSIMIGGAGKLFTVNLQNYGVTSADLSDADALMGNLVCVDGKLIAANAAGVCAYFKYEEARDRLTARLAKAQPADQGDLLLFRGLLAFNAKRFDEAIADYQACHKQATDAQDKAMLAKVMPCLYRAYVASGNHAAKPEGMIAAFKNAQAQAVTESDKARILLRLAKAYELAKDFPTAAQTAQALAEQLPNEEIVDVEIGPKADAVVRDKVKEQLIPAKAIAVNFLNRLIAANGRACYAKFDALADEAYKKALAAADVAALEKVADNWPIATRASEAVFAAAEINYKDAAGKQGEEAQQLIEKTLEELNRVYNEPASARNTSATVALATIFARDGHQPYAAMLLERVRDLPADTPVAFANIKGALGEKIKEIDAGNVVRLPDPIRRKVSLDMPLRDIFRLSDADSVIVRDQNGNPVRATSGGIDENILMLQGNRALLVDASAKEEKLAIAWSGLANADALRYRTSSMMPACSLIGGLSRDGKIIAVADRSTGYVTGMKVDSARVDWQTTMSELGIGNLYCMAMDGGYFVGVDSSGKITCIDLCELKRDGKDKKDAKKEILWQANLFAGRPPQGQIQVGVPQIGGNMVVICYNGQRAMKCLSLTNGKLLDQWEGTFVDGLITPDGLLVTQVNGNIAVRDQGQSKPLWTQSYSSQQGQEPALLMAAKDKIVVLSARSGNNARILDVLSIVGGGKKLASFTTSDVNGQMAVPVDVAMDDKNLYVTTNNSYVGTRRLEAMRRITLASMGVQKFEIGGKSSAVWAKGLVEGGTPQVTPFAANPMATNVQPGIELLPLQVTDKYVAVAVKYMQRADNPATVQVLDAADGKVAEKYDTGMKEDGQVKSDRGRFIVMGAPVVTSGRLTVESFEGVTVYGK